MTKFLRLVVVLFSVMTTEVFAQSSQKCGEGQCCGNTTPTLKDAYQKYWYTGVSVNQWQVKADETGANVHDVTGQISNDQTADWPIIVKNFNWVVAENGVRISTSCSTGSSNLRTISSPLRSDSFQWIWRIGSPGTYSRMANVSLGSLPGLFCEYFSLSDRTAVLSASTICSGVS